MTGADAVHRVHRPEGVAEIAETSGPPSDRSSPRWDTCVPVRIGSTRAGWWSKLEGLLRRRGGLNSRKASQIESSGSKRIGLTRKSGPERIKTQRNERNETPRKLGRLVRADGERVRFLRTQQCVKSQCMKHNPVPAAPLWCGGWKIFLWLMCPHYWVLSAGVNSINIVWRV